jgi:formylglycine-generating enzyme required for sulfatase activity
VREFYTAFPGYDEFKGPEMSAFQMGNTEVPWELWDKVRAWGVAGHNYSFNNSGWKGSTNAAGNTKHPVTKITWFDAIVWCNALTEYYNAAYNPTVPLTPVYYYDSAYTNVARHSALAYPKAGATGFRLPTLDEWEFAYRYEGTQIRSATALWADGIYFSHSDSASGAASQSEPDVRYVAYFDATGT